MSDQNQKPDVSAGSPDRFGYSWGRFFEYSEDQREQFLRWTSPIDPQTGWLGKSFLDVGCGAGRNSYWALSLGAESGVAIDVGTESLDAARRNLSKYPAITVTERSAYDIQETERFDIVFSIGVIHHLEFPDLALSQMTAAAKQGGQVLIWVYGRESMGMYLAAMDPLRKHIFRKLPVKLVRLLAFPATVLLWAFLRLRIGNLEYFRLLRTFQFKHLHHIIFDQMLPEIANYWRKDEVEALLRRAGLTNIRVCDVNGMSWAGIGVKPASGK